MRPIKFRAKRIDNGWWVYGNLFKTPLTTENFTPANQINFFDVGGDRWCIVHEHGVVFEIDIDTVGQFTGLHDKDGKEIYDGDRIRIVWVQQHWQTHTGDNIIGGSYTEPDISTIESCDYEVKFEGGAFVIDNSDWDVPGWDNLLSTYLGDWNDHVFLGMDDDYFEEEGYKTLSDLKKVLGVTVVGDVFTVNNN